MRDKAFITASDPKYDGYQRELPSVVYKFFDKKSSGNGIANEPNYQLADQLHKPIIQKKKIIKLMEKKKKRKEKFIHHLEAIFGVLI